MKMYIVFAAVLAVALAAPVADSDKDAQVLKYESDNIGVDGYHFAYETSNGLSRSEHAEVKNLGTDHESIAITGVISWVDAEGNKYNLEFVADENGFQPKGDHLPHN